MTKANVLDAVAVLKSDANEKNIGRVQMKTKDWPEYRNESEPISAEWLTPMITSVRNHVAYAWNFIFNHEVSPLRNIPDVAIRHYVLQALGLMWATSFSLAIGSYTFFAASLLGHAVLIAAAAITVATLTTAAKKPQVFVRMSGRRQDGEHE
jgi:hypothetical protein